jgi:glyceraldehyde 3-phosphate dehydrogenase
LEPTTRKEETKAKVVLTNFGIKKAVLTTVHSYTADQELQDGSHKDLRRARAAAANIIPTTTGAARATGKTLPELSGKFDGLAVRVPTVVGSLSDLTFLVEKPTSVSEVNKAFSEASKGKFAGIIEVTDEPLVSSDIIGMEASAIVDLGLTRVIDGDLVKVVAWYDNEWGYANRLVEEILAAGK